MRKLFILLVMIAAATLSKGLCRDSLAVFEIKSTNRLVRSASIQVPANTMAYIVYESNNTNKTLELNQGVLIDYGGGNVAVQYQSLDSTNSSNWSIRSFPRAAVVENPYFVQSTGVRGPCTISFFCLNSGLRGSVYSMPDYSYSSYWANTLIKPSSQKLTISVRQGNLGAIEKEFFGISKPTITSRSGLANVFVSSNGFFSSQPYFYDNTATNYKSSVVSWATVYEIKTQRKVNRGILGPMTIEIAYTNKTDTNSFAFIRYYVSPANYTYNTTSGVNVVKDDVSSKKQSGRLVFEKSLDQKKWLPAKDMYVTDTSGEAYYRLRLEEL